MRIAQNNQYGILFWHLLLYTHKKDNNFGLPILFLTLLMIVKVVNVM